MGRIDLTGPAKSRDQISALPVQLRLDAACWRCLDLINQLINDTGVIFASYRTLTAQQGIRGEKIMSISRTPFKSTLLWSAIFAALSVGNAMAQETKRDTGEQATSNSDEQTKPNTEEQLKRSAKPTDEARVMEEVIVTGIRQSLEQAVDIKRDSAQILDVITAEDVGKLPDNNVAEALQRVTGVQITRVFGEGQAVNIRGLQQVRVEVDGRTLLAWSARVSPPENDNLGRSSGLDSVPASSFGRLEVFKSPLSSQVEGGLGGTVNLVTPKPLDLPKDIASLRGQYTFSDESDKFEPTFGATFSKKLMDGRLGFLFSGEYLKRTSNLQLFERNNWFSVLNGAPAGSPQILAPRLLQFENTDIDRTRQGANATVQFEVTPNFTLTADALYSKIESARTNQFIAFNLPTSPTTAIIRNPVVENGFAVAGTATGRIRTGNQFREDPTANWMYGLNGKYVGQNGFTIEGDAYHSEGTLKQKIEVFTLDSPANVVGNYDFRNGTIPGLTLTTLTGQPWDPTTYANYSPQTSGLTPIRANYLPANLKENSGRFDLTYDLSANWAIQGGVRYTALSADFQSFRSRAPAVAADLLPFLDYGSADFLSSISGNFPRLFVSARPGQGYIIERGLAVEPNLTGDGVGSLRRNQQRDFYLDENVRAAYLMFDGYTELAGLPTRINAGARVMNTDFSVDTYTTQGTTVGGLRTDTNKYTDVLPSATITVNATDDFLVRFAASKTLQRAGLQDLAPSTFVDATNRTSTSGNAALVPPTSTNADVSFEWYFRKGSLLSGAVFHKDVKDFIAINTTQAIIPGFESLGEIRITRPNNVASAVAKGFEIGIQHFFDDMPKPFDGFGVLANYTYVDAIDSNGNPLVATSKNSYNFTALYEKGRLKGRIAYNWRDDAVFEFTEGRPDFIKARSQLDAQLGIDLTKRLVLSFQAQNLLPKKSATVEFANFNPTALNSYALSERRFSIGLRLKF
jgi:iron complex outermembrane recepter protein